MEYSLLGKSATIGQGTQRTTKGSPSKWYSAQSKTTLCNAPATITVSDTGLSATVCGEEAYSVEHDAQGWTGITRCKKHHPKNTPVRNPN